MMMMMMLEEDGSANRGDCYGSNFKFRKHGIVTCGSVASPLCPRRAYRRPEVTRSVVRIRSSRPRKASVTPWFLGAYHD